MTRKTNVPDTLSIVPDTLSIVPDKLSIVPDTLSIVPDTLSIVPDIMSFAYSLAGRDKGRPVLILAIEDGYAQICDGVTRKVGKPKRKKLRHLRVTDLLIYDGELTDRGIAKAIKAFAESGAVPKN